MTGDALTELQANRRDLLRMALERVGDMDRALAWAARAACFVEQGPGLSAFAFPASGLGLKGLTDALSDQGCADAAVYAFAARDFSYFSHSDMPAERGEETAPEAPQPEPAPSEDEASGTGGGIPMPVEAPPPAEAPPPIAEPAGPSLADRVHGLLAAAAREGRPCPTGRDMAQALDDTESMITSAFATLRGDGRIQVETRGPRRRVLVDGRYTGWTGGWVPPEESAPGEAVDAAAAPLEEEIAFLASRGVEIARVGGEFWFRDKVIGEADIRAMAQRKRDLIAAARPEATAA